jgi:hypothetical protein
MYAASRRPGVQRTPPQHSPVVHVLATLLRRRLAYFLVQFVRCVTGHPARAPRAGGSFRAQPSMAACHAAEASEPFHLG